MAEPPPRFELSLTNPGRYPGLRLRDVRSWLQGLVAEMAPQTRSLGVLFASDRRLRALNRHYRGQDVATDVLSFPGGSTPEGRHLGDIAIAVPTARRRAAAAGHSLRREVEMLLLHGVLHCLGHDHESDGGAMDRLEDRLRRRWVADD